MTVTLYATKTAKLRQKPNHQKDQEIPNELKIMWNERIVKFSISAHIIIADFFSLKNLLK